MKPKSPKLSLHLHPELASLEQYEIKKELGFGGMSLVYLAENLHMGRRKEALKVLNDAQLRQLGARERFDQEIAVAARLHHPNIVIAYSAFKLPSLSVFAMQYIQGLDLAQYVRKHGPLPISTACRIASQVAEGLQYAHEMNTIHRDIKPANIMITKSGATDVVKILDFGLAKAQMEVGAPQGLTSSGTALGTPHFMAPEQLISASSVDIRSDIYSLGCTLYHLLTGQPPFSGTIFEVYVKHRTEALRPIGLSRLEMPPELDAVLAKMLAKDPSDRHQRPAEIVSDLLPFLNIQAPVSSLLDFNISDGSETIDVSPDFTTIRPAEVTVEVNAHKAPTVPAITPPDFIAASEPVEGTPTNNFPFATAAQSTEEPSKPKTFTEKILPSELAEHVTLVGFFQWLRCIQLESRKQIGTDRKPQDEPVKIRGDLSAAFASTELAKLNNSGDKPTLDVSFLGLYGPSGALPLHYTQTLIERVRLKDHALREFLDLFNHRLLSHLYRCWEKHQSAIAFETASACGVEDAITSSQWALIGGVTLGTRQRYHFDDSALLYFAGHLSNRRPTAESLRLMVQQVFDMPVVIQQFVGQWMQLPPSDQSRVGCEPLGMSLGNQLGKDTILGQRVWDNENRFRLQIGPLTWDRFQEFSPAQSLLRDLTHFVRRIVGPQYDFDIRVVVKREQVQGASLHPDGAAQLGWNTWLGQWRKPQDADEAIFELPDYSLNNQL